MLSSRPFTSVCVLALVAGLAASAASGQSDSCAAAPLIGLGTHSGTTIGATNDGNSGCGSSASSPDVWYKYVATGNDALVVETCGGAAWDTVLSIHSGCPGSLGNALACNDDQCGMQSRVTASMVAGRTYYIRVSGFGNSAGAYSINVSLETAPPPPSLGPDVWVAELIDIAYYATVGNTAAYAVGTDACNKGDADAMWVSSTNRHPVIAQNLYRLKDGRFEQVGQSWLKHGFASTNSATCGTCQMPSAGGAALGPNCSDAYGAGLNGSQGLLGPRSQVNPATGVFPYPFSAAPFTGDIARRLQVNTADVLPAQNANAQYYAECHYITQDDAQWGQRPQQRLVQASQSGFPHRARLLHQHRPRAVRDSGVASGRSHRGHQQCGSSRAGRGARQQSHGPLHRRREGHGQRQWHLDLRVRRAQRQLQPCRRRVQDSPASLRQREQHRLPRRARALRRAIRRH